MYLTYLRTADVVHGASFLCSARPAANDREQCSQRITCCTKYEVVLRFDSMWKGGISFPPLHDAIDASKLLTLSIPLRGIGLLDYILVGLRIFKNIEPAGRAWVQLHM